MKNENGNCEVNARISLLVFDEYIDVKMVDVILDLLDWDMITLCLGIFASCEEEDGK